MTEQTEISEPEIVNNLYLLTFIFVKQTFAAHKREMLPNPSSKDNNKLNCMTRYSWVVTIVTVEGQPLPAHKRDILANPSSKDNKN